MKYKEHRDEVREWLAVDKNFCIGEEDTICLLDMADRCEELEAGLRDFAGRNTIIHPRDASRLLGDALPDRTAPGGFGIAPEWDVEP